MKNIIGIVSDSIGLYVIVFLVTLITTYLSLSFLLKIIKQGKIKWFSIYCITVGIIIVISKL